MGDATALEALSSKQRHDRWAGCDVPRNVLLPRELKDMRSIKWKVALLAIVLVAGLTVALRTDVGACPTVNTTAVCDGDNPVLYWGCISGGCGSCVWTLQRNDGGTWTTLSSNATSPYTDTIGAGCHDYRVRCGTCPWVTFETICCPE